MKLSPIILTVSLAIFSIAALADDAKPADQPAEKPAAKTEAPKKISALEATNYYDKTMIVTGKVAQVTALPKITFINLDKRHPNSPFACVIRGEATNQFPEVKKLMGKQVEIKGKIIKYNDKPEIVLTSSNQVTVIETPADTAPKTEAKPEAK